MLQVKSRYNERNKSQNTPAIPLGFADTVNPKTEWQMSCQKALRSPKHSGAGTVAIDAHLVVSQVAYRFLMNGGSTFYG